MSCPSGAGSLRRAATAVLPALLFAACTWFQPFPAPQEVPRNETFERALALVEARSFAEADVLLRRVASTCESGADGRRALMLLAAISLDPRNRGSQPDSAALLAARYVFLPDLEPGERLVAESLYALALDLGGSPFLRPARTSGPGMLAVRFSDCGSANAALSDPLPTLPALGRETRAAALRSLLQSRDSLANLVSGSQQDSSRLAQQAKDLENELQRAQADLQAALAELQRIRRLLAGPDTTRFEHPR